MAPPKIVLGQTSQPPGSGADQASSSSGRVVSSGYALDAGRSAYDIGSAKTSSSGRTIILVLLLIAGVLALVTGGEESNRRTIGYNAALIDEYKQYLTTRVGSLAPGTPTPDQIARELNAIAFLESTGRAAEAKRAWASMVVSCQSARDDGNWRLPAGNPVCREARVRLERAR